MILRTKKETKADIWIQLKIFQKKIEISSSQMYSQHEVTIMYKLTASAGDKLHTNDVGKKFRH